MEIPLFIDSLEIVSGKIDCKSSRKNKRLQKGISAILISSSREMIQV